MNLDASKRRAAEHAVDYVRSGSAIGLGTGSTVQFVLEALGQRLQHGHLEHIVGVPTSERTAKAAAELGIPLGSLEDHPHLDLTLDGADEIDPSLNLIKGLGGALLREKIVAAASRELVIVADGTKLVPRLGSRCPVPVEVIPFALPVVFERLAHLAGRVQLRRDADGNPFHTDERNLIVDCYCGPIENPANLAASIRAIPGVVEHGLFLDIAQRAVVSRESSVQVMERS